MENHIPVHSGESGENTNSRELKNHLVFRMMQEFEKYGFIPDDFLSCQIIVTKEKIKDEVITCFWHETNTKVRHVYFKEDIFSMDFEREDILKKYIEPAACYLSEMIMEDRDPEYLIKYLQSLKDKFQTSSLKTN